MAVSAPACGAGVDCARLRARLLERLVGGLAACMLRVRVVLGAVLRARDGWQVCKRCACAAGARESHAPVHQCGVWTRACYLGHKWMQWMQSPKLSKPQPSIHQSTQPRLTRLLGVARGRQPQNKAPPCTMFGQNVLRARNAPNPLYN